MPKPARSPEEIEEIRQRILETALELIGKDGFEQFSMRKLASRLNITATTIYNYYSSKDELYLAVLTRGFEELYAEMLKGYNAGDDPMDKLGGLLRKAIKFGITRANFYNIMFTWNVPKYNNYVGTPEEARAFIELQAALQCGELLKKAIIEARLDSSPYQKDDLAWVQVLCTIHGLITLFNSRIVEYLLDADDQQYSDEFVNKFVDSFLIRYI